MRSTTRPKYRALFISDLHLGSRACRADEILDFLREYNADTIYLVGDVVDFWRLKHRSYWPQTHNDVIQKLLRKVRKGTRIVFIPGNHDEALRDYCETQFGGITIANEAVHETADGCRILVLHGDAFDGTLRHTKRVKYLCGPFDHFTKLSNSFVNRLRGLFGLPDWSLSKSLKSRIQNAVQFIDRFETALAYEARRRGFDGVICGHIHHASDKIIDGIAYRNCGDWVESCTALVEDYEGSFRVVNWYKDVAREAPPTELAKAA